MTSYSDNAYDVTIFCCFEQFLAYTVFLLSFIVVRHQMTELNWGGALLRPHPIIGVSRTPFKIGLKAHLPDRRNHSGVGHKVYPIEISMIKRHYDYVLESVS